MGKNQDPGSGINIQDPQHCLDPGFEMGKKSRSDPGSGIRIRDEYFGSYFRELRNNFL
jgi:hypothetical protein